MANIYHIDLTAYDCPLPLFMLKKALTQIEKGAIAIVQLNQTASLADFALFCAEQGYQLSEMPKTADQNSDEFLPNKASENVQNRLQYQQITRLKIQT